MKDINELEIENGNNNNHNEESEADIKWYKRTLISERTFDIGSHAPLRARRYINSYNDYILSIIL